MTTSQLNELAAMNDAPTLETDAAIVESNGQCTFALRAKMEKLERERDAARVENEAMRAAIREAHEALGGCLKYILTLPLSGSDYECETTDDAHHAMRKLKPFIQ